jgi:hypothetical protein
MREIAWLLILIGLVLMVAGSGSLIHPNFPISLREGFLVLAVGLVILAIRRPERGSRRSCPFCGEQIKREAVVCFHCRSRVPQDTVRARWTAYKTRYRATVKERRK